MDSIGVEYCPILVLKDLPRDNDWAVTHNNVTGCNTQQCKSSYSHNDMHHDHNWAVTHNTDSSATVTTYFAIMTEL